MRCVFYLLNMCREFILLPLLIACVPTLCAYMGSDSLAIIVANAKCIPYYKGGVKGIRRSRV